MPDDEKVEILKKKLHTWYLEGYQARKKGDITNIFRYVAKKILEEKE